MRVLTGTLIFIVAFAFNATAFDMPWAAKKEDPNKKTNAIYRKALGAYGMADYAKAIKLTTDTVTMDPKFAKGYALRGKAKKDMGDVDGAVTDLNKALGLDPNLGEAYYVRAQVSEIMGEMDKAKADYAKGCKAGYRDAC